MSKRLQVGIIGASAAGGWARESHVPAVQGTPGLELGAVVTRRQDKAREAAHAFGARVGYGDPQQLFDDPSIDIVTVAVKVPEHHHLVLGALAARKSVFCEWPLSPTLAQAEELAQAARQAGVKVAIGLQARANPTAVQARTLIEQGAIGRVLAARCVSTSAAWGGEIEPAMAFAEKPEAGVNLVIIQGCHTVDLMISLVGGLADISSLATRQYPQVAIKGESRSVARETFDHVIAAAHLDRGGTLVAEVMGGRPSGDTPFALEIFGDKGQLCLRGGAARGFQSGRLTLSLNGAHQKVDEGLLSTGPEAALNVAGIYALLRDDILHDTHTAPDFDHAVRLTRLFDDIIASSAEGRRKPRRDWPRRDASDVAESPTRFAEQLKGGWHA